MRYGLEYWLEAAVSSISEVALFKAVKQKDRKREIMINIIGNFKLLVSGCSRILVLISELPYFLKIIFRIINHKCTNGDESNYLFKLRTV